MSVLRIAYVLNMFPKLSETFIAGELAELRRRGVELKVFSLRVPEEELRHDIVVRAGLDERTVYDARAFRPLLRKFRPQLIHAHFATKATAAARELASELRVPFTFTAHRYDIYDKPPADFAARAAAAAAVVTVSQANVRYMVDTLGVEAGNIHLISCGVDTEQFRSNGARADPPHIVCVARLKPFKNQKLLLEACALLCASGVVFRCVLVGDGPTRDELVALRARLGLERVVELVGAARQSQVLGWWQRASVAALTSESEGMPVCLMEAAACGVPAVATAVGGVAEMIEHGVTGLLAPSRNAVAVAAALKRLLVDRDLAARMGSAARRLAVERFSVVHQVDRLLALWAQLLGTSVAR